MIMRFSGQVALVTGGAGALGFGIARRLATEGATLELVDQDASALERSREALPTAPAAGAAHGASVCDVTDETRVGAVVADVLARRGRIDVLVCAAGINGVTNLRTHELPPEEFDRVQRINLFGTFHFVRAVLPAMLAARYGRIVNVASIAGKEGNARMVAYSASKAAIIGLTKAVGKEYAESGITCNAIAPALVRTAATEQAHSAERFRQLTAAIPMGRTGEVDEIAAVVAFMASRECSFTTGFTFDASGGRATY